MRLHALGLRASALAALSLALFGCSESGAPGSNDPDGLGRFDGSIDPGKGEFTLQAVDGPAQNGRRLDLRLIGRNLQVIASENRVSLEVAMENADIVPIYSPGQVEIGEFRPTTIVPLNADGMTCPGDSTPDTPIELDDECVYVFDYSSLLGADGALGPGERSAFRRWEFLDPDLQGFSFSAAARFRMEPDGAVIAGEIFHDYNENGVRDPGEGPWGAGAVQVEGPGIPTTTAFAGPDGAWSVAIRESGLHRATAFSPLDFGPVEPRFTTPNPLEVLIVPGPTGNPVSYREANFGVVRFPSVFPPPIRFWDGPSDSLEGDHYLLAGIEVVEENDYLLLDVGYSGCQPDHPFALYMTGGIMESLPPQARIVLVHDGLGELCDAAWQKDLTFNLRPLIDLLGDYEGVLILRFEDFQGNVTVLEWQPGVQRAE